MPSTVTIEGQNYRISDSVIPAGDMYEKIRKIFLEHGISDYANALAPRSRSRYVQVFVMSDGTARMPDPDTMDKIWTALAKLRAPVSA